MGQLLNFKIVRRNATTAELWQIKTKPQIIIDNLFYETKMTGGDKT